MNPEFSQRSDRTPQISEEIILAEDTDDEEPFNYNLFGEHDPDYEYIADDEHQLSTPSNHPSLALSLTSPISIPSTTPTDSLRVNIIKHQIKHSTKTQQQYEEYDDTFLQSPLYDLMSPPPPFPKSPLNHSLMHNISTNNTANTTPVVSTNTANPTTPIVDSQNITIFHAMVLQTPDRYPMAARNTCVDLLVKGYLRIKLLEIYLRLPLEIIPFLIAYLDPYLRWLLESQYPLVLINSHKLKSRNSHSFRRLSYCSNFSDGGYSSAGSTSGTNTPPYPNPILSPNNSDADIDNLSTIISSAASARKPLPRFITRPSHTSCSATTSPRHRLQKPHFLPNIIQRSYSGNNLLYSHNLSALHTHLSGLLINEYINELDISRDHYKLYLEKNDWKNLSISQKYIVHDILLHACSSRFSNTYRNDNNSNTGSNSNSNRSNNNSEYDSGYGSSNTNNNICRIHASSISSIVCNNVSLIIESDQSPVSSSSSANFNSCNTSGSTSPNNGRHINLMPFSNISFNHNLNIDGSGSGSGCRKYPQNICTNVDTNVNVIGNGFSTRVITPPPPALNANMNGNPSYDITIKNDEIFASNLNDIQWLAQIISRNNRLTKIEISNANNLQNFYKFHFFMQNAFSSSKLMYNELKEITIDSCKKFNDECLQLLLHVIQRKCSNVTHLHLYRTCVSDKSCARIIKFLDVYHWHPLWNIDLEFCVKITDEGVMQWVRFFRKYPFRNFYVKITGRAMFADHVYHEQRLLLSIYP